MKIISTNILDINNDNIDQIKLDLANNIINNIGPLLDSDFIKLQNLNQDLSESLKKLKYEINANKNILEKISIEYSRKKKQEELINIIYEIFENVKLANNYELKNHIKLVLKTIDDLKEKILNEQIKKFKIIFNQHIK